VGFTSNFVSDCPFKLFLVVQTLTQLFSLIVPNFVVIFRLLNRKFNEKLKNVLKLSFSHSMVVSQAILSLTVLSNCVSSSSNFDIAFLPDCTKFSSIFQVMG